MLIGWLGNTVTHLLEKSRVTILLYIASLDTGGAEIQTIRLANALTSAGYKVVLCCNYPVSEGDLPVPLNEPGQCELRFLFQSTPKAKLLKHSHSLIAGVLLARLIKEVKPQLLYSSLYASNAAAAVACFLSRHRPQLAWSIRTSRPKQKLLIKAWFAVCRLLSGRVDVFFSNSKAGLEYHKAKGFNIRREVLLPNFIDFDYFTPDQKVEGALPRIGIIGRIDRTKNIACAIRAYAEARKSVDLAPLSIVGPVSDRGYQLELANLSVKLGVQDAIVWSGLCTDVLQVYRRLDILLNTSSIEGFSNVLCEAMSCNVFCIATRVGDSAVILGGSGALVDDNDHKAVAQNIVAFSKGAFSDEVSPRDNLQNRYSDSTTIDVFTQGLSALT